MVLSVDLTRRRPNQRLAGLGSMAPAASLKLREMKRAVKPAISSMGTTVTRTMRVAATGVERPIVEVTRRRIMCVMISDVLE